MIDLTPLEVRKKKGDFRRQMRGYDPALVDDFLDLVADRLEQLVRENMSITERIHLLETQTADYREREKALTEALVTAQEMREDMRRQAEKENDLARREAEHHAEQIRASAVHAREREEDSIRRLRARQTQLLHSYRTYLERELAELQVISETLEVSRAMGLVNEESPAAARAGQQAVAAQHAAAHASAQPASAQPAPAQHAPAQPAPAPVAKPAPAFPPQQPAAAFPPPALPDLGLTAIPERRETPVPPSPSPSAPAAPQMSLEDDIEDDGEADTGWVSTLIENKG
jgi:cell division initiation protein